MVLQFSGAWRFQPPTDGMFLNSTIPDEAIEDVFALIAQVAQQGDRQRVLEHFKANFCEATGATHVRSSNASWAETDLRDYMRRAAENAPLFIEALYDACETLSRYEPSCYVPDVPMINGLLSKHGVGYEIRPPDLLLRDHSTQPVSVPERPQTMAERAAAILQASLGRSEQLLSEGRGREAVQEILWLLETVATAFRGLETTTGSIEGKYFNRITRDLKRLNRGSTQDRILEWMTALHGYLSSPTGGGIRHGLDLAAGISISPNEARLFCNLVRSYLSFLITEHERFVRSGGAT